MITDYRLSILVLEIVNYSKHGLGDMSGADLPHSRDLLQSTHVVEVHPVKSGNSISDGIHLVHVRKHSD